MGWQFYLSRYDGNDRLKSREEPYFPKAGVFVWNARKLIFRTNHRVVRRIEDELDDISGICVRSIWSEKETTIADVNSVCRSRFGG